jgi:putative restriction endonuclease
MLKIQTVNEAVEALYALNVGVVGTGSNRHERPHKPVLLLAMLDLIATAHATADRVPWSQELRSRFATYFEVVRRADDQITPENPFFYLKGDEFWQPIETQDRSERALANTPTVSQARAGNVFARVKGGLETFLRRSDQRATLRDALVSRYFPNARARLTKLFAEHATKPTELYGSSRCSEDEGKFRPLGRDPAFRRIVLIAYDFQCAACGLRIKLPDADLTFVDGAHLIPFGESGNDHPTNGLALCKNHHWAMDRFLIVPTPERIWKASGRLDARRSPGEQALVALDGQPLLPPHDDAFQPNRDSLAWRAERLYG